MPIFPRNIESTKCSRMRRVNRFFTELLVGLFLVWWMIIQFNSTPLISLYLIDPAVEAAAGRTSLPVTDETNDHYLYISYMNIFR